MNNSKVYLNSDNVLNVEADPYGEKQDILADIQLSIKDILPSLQGKELLKIVCGFGEDIAALVAIAVVGSVDAIAVYDAGSFAYVVIASKSVKYPFGTLLTA